jgi:hypothetical protein
MRGPPASSQFSFACPQPLPGSQRPARARPAGGGAGPDRGQGHLIKPGQRDGHSWPGHRLRSGVTTPGADPPVDHGSRARKEGRAAGTPAPTSRSPRLAGSPVRRAVRAGGRGRGPGARSWGSAGTGTAPQPGVPRRHGFQAGSLWHLHGFGDIWGGAGTAEKGTRSPGRPVTVTMAVTVAAGSFGPDQGSRDPGSRGGRWPRSVGSRRGQGPTKAVTWREGGRLCSAGLCRDRTEL